MRSSSQDMSLIHGPGTNSLKIYMPVRHIHVYIGHLVRMSLPSEPSQIGQGSRECRLQQLHYHYILRVLKLRSMRERYKNSKRLKHPDSDKDKLV